MKQKITLPISHEERKYLKAQRDRVMRENIARRKAGGKMWDGVYSEDKRPQHLPPLIVIPRSGEWPPHVGAPVKSR